MQGACISSVNPALRVSLQLDAWLKGARKKLDNSVRIRQKVRGSVQPAASSGLSSSHLDERFSRLEANINKRMDEFLDRAQKSLSALQVQPTSDQSASTAAVNDRGATVSDSRHFCTACFQEGGGTACTRVSIGAETSMVQKPRQSASCSTPDCLLEMRIAWTPAAES